MEREGAADRKTMQRKNRKSGSTILYLTITPVQQGTRRKSTFPKKLLEGHVACTTIRGHGSQPPAPPQYSIDSDAYANTQTVIMLLIDRHHQRTD